MTHLAGKTGSVYYTTDGTSGDVVIIAGMKSWSLDYVSDALETTDFAATGVRDYVAGCTSWSGSFEGVKDAAPTALGTITVVDLRESTDTTQKWTGAALITGAHPSVSFDGVVSYSYDFQGTGALTVATA